jgi:uncharacterized protein YndB with AHSA1/START domain
MDIEYGPIQKQIRLDAPPQVVYEVVSSPKHIAASWFDEADLEPTSGGTGILAAGPGTGRMEVPIAFVEAIPNSRLSFHWVAPPARAVPEGTALTEHIANLAAEAVQR